MLFRLYILVTEFLLCNLHGEKIVELLGLEFIVEDERFIFLCTFIKEDLEFTKDELLKLVTESLLLISFVD